MKKYIILALVLIVALFSFSNSFATLRIVQVSDFVFTPAILNANAGDTVRWVWVSGFHTTTSTTIPAGAQSWDELITSSDPTYNYVLTTSGTYNYVCTPHAGMGMVGQIIVSPTGIEKQSEIAGNYRLQQNYPNPFNPSTTVKFSLPLAGFTTLKIYDVYGREIKSLVNQNLNGGEYSYNFEGKNLASGIYYYRIQSGSFNETKSMMLIK